jgi:hypothetical protein
MWIHTSLFAIFRKFPSLKLDYFHESCCANRLVGALNGRVTPALLTLLKGDFFNANMCIYVDKCWKFFIPDNLCSHKERESERLYGISPSIRSYAGNTILNGMYLRLSMKLFLYCAFLAKYIVFPNNFYWELYIGSCWENLILFCNSLISVAICVKLIICKKKSNDLCKRFARYKILISRSFYLERFSFSLSNEIPINNDLV